jgi:hypothetical protein
MAGSPYCRGEICLYLCAVFKDNHYFFFGIYFDAVNQCVPEKFIKFSDESRLLSQLAVEAVCLVKTVSCRRIFLSGMLIIFLCLRACSVSLQKSKKVIS